MKNNRLNLIYKLNHIVNQNEIGTVEYELAKFFSENFKQLKALSIEEVMRSNHVSRSSVRRFTHQLGYENFSEMKKDADDFDDGIQRYESFYGQEEFIPALTSNIHALMTELSARMNMKEINRLIDLMNEAEDVVIISSSNIAGIVKTFQLQMIVLGKRVTLLTDKEDLEKYANTNKELLIIVFSISGLFLSSIFQELKDMNGEKILFTIKREPSYNQHFKKIYHLCSQDYTQVSDLLYYTYGIMFVLDIIFNGFVRKKEESD